MKRYTILIMALFTTLSLSASASNEVESDSLVIYAYDSFTSEWGAGPQIVALFEEKFGINVELIGFGDAGTVLTKVISEKDQPKADIIIGIDNNMLAEAINQQVLEPYSSEAVKNIPSELLFDKENHLIPFDYGYFSIIYDSEVIQNPPMSLEDLTKPEFEKSLILMDPRTSSPGLGFLLWTKAIYGDNYLDYWNRLKPSILTIADGWSSGYGLFTQGEAPLVLSYTTSPPYHVEYEGTEKYKASIFEKGNYIQIEGLGIIKGSTNIINARKFIDFIISDEAQAIIPLTNFMFPVNPNVELPASFDYAPKPENNIQLDYKEIELEYNNWLNEWAENSVN